MPADDFKDLVLDQLSQLAGLDCQRMFGGHGLYTDAVFFGILWRGYLFFKTDDESRDEYEQRGMKPFRPNDKQTLKNYFQVPVEIVENADLLVEWAQRAASC